MVEKDSNIESENEKFAGKIERLYVRKEMWKIFIISLLNCGGIFAIGYLWMKYIPPTPPPIAFTILYYTDAAIFVLINLIGYIFQYAYWKSFQYSVTDKYIRIHSGVLTQSKTTIPFSRIQNINITQGVFDRIFGLHTVKIETAGRSGSPQQGGPIRPEGYIPGIKDPIRISEIIDKLVHKYTQKKVDPGIGDYIFEDNNVAFDEFIAYILSKMMECDKMRTRVKELREGRGLSQAKLAEELGVSRQTVNYLERGKYVPSLTLAMKIAKFFQVSVEEIFELEEET